MSEYECLIWVVKLAPRPHHVCLDDSSWFMWKMHQFTLTKHTLVISVAFQHTGLANGALLHVAARTGDKTSGTRTTLYMNKTDAI